MDIVYINQHHQTPDACSGVRSWEFSRRLVARGHRVHLLAADTTARPGATAWTVTEEAGATVHRCPVPYSNRMGFTDRIRAFARFAWLAASRAASLPQDVVLATSTPLTVAVPGIWSSRRRRTPMVFEVRDVWPEVPIAMGALRNPLGRRAALALERAAYRHAAEIIALSPDMAASIERRFPGARVTTIPNSCDLDRFADPDPGAVAAVRAARPWLGDRPLVLYAGTFGPANDVGYLAEVAAHLRSLAPEVRVLLLGSGRDGGALEQRARALGVWRVNLFVEPPVPQREMPTHLGAADVCASVFADLPELGANSPNKAFDAFAAGRPVVINNGGWLGEVLEHSGAGLSLPRDTALAARRLAERIGDPQWRARAGRAARGLAEHTYARDLLFESFEQVLTRAARAGGQLPTG